MTSLKSKWRIWMKVLFSKKNIYRSFHAEFPKWLTFFVEWSPHVEIIIKELWCHCPLNYWWKGRSVWWGCLFNDIWFDKEHALCIALNSLVKSERRLAGSCNFVEHWNVAGIWFHVKGLVYDSHIPTTFLLTGSCCDQIQEQFLTCRFQITLSRYT